MEPDRTLPTVALQLIDLRRNLATIQRNADGIDDASALLSPWEGGSHFNWLVGHMTQSRCHLLRVMGGDAPWSAERAARYSAGTDPAGPDDAEPFAELLAALEATEAPLAEALTALTPADLDRTPHGGRVAVRVSLDFLVWHDSYHSGQSAIYRRLAGLDRTSP